MSEQELVRKALANALSGQGAHVATAEIFDGVDWESAWVRPDGVPHSLFEQLNHLVYWQEFALRWLDGEKPATPEHDEDSWPGEAGPADREDWAAAVALFKSTLSDLLRRTEEADLHASLGPKTALEILQVVAAHASYHAGQVAAMRRAMGKWPPPGGGFTW